MSIFILFLSNIWSISIIEYKHFLQLTTKEYIKKKKNIFKCQIDSFTLVKKITLLFHLEIVFVNISYVNENQ